MTKAEYLTKISELSKEEQIKFLENAYNQVKGTNLSEAIVLCELLAHEYEYYGYRFNLVELYNDALEYKKTIDYVNEWLTACAQNPAEIMILEGPIFNLGKAYSAIGDNQAAISAFNKTIDIIKDKHLASGASILDESAKNNISLALNEIGKIYFNSKNYEKAFEYFDKSGDNKLTLDACYYAGIMFYNGWGTAKDVESAENLLSMVLRANDVATEMKKNTYYILGKIHATENGYINKEKAKSYLETAKNSGYEIDNEEIKILINTPAAPSSSSSTSSKSGGCYVATCVYGSYDCPEVWTLRRFRDNILSKNTFGKLFIKFYYFVSPTAVKLFGHYNWFHQIFKKPLDKFVATLISKGLENTPYTDK